MEATEIINNILPSNSAYKKTLYLMNRYKDLKDGASINNNSREVLEILNKAIEMIENDRDFNIIRMRYIEGVKEEDIALILTADIKTIYRKKKRIIKRLSIIFYGDNAL